MFDILREYPTLALLLTVGLGFLIGRIKIGNFSLGPVTSVLIVGIVVGQLDIPMSGPVKMLFFMLFLFSIGYSVGPDFFRSLKGSGGRQALFAVCMSTVIFLTVLGMAKLFSYTKGETVGLFSGSETCSALLGVGSESISRLPWPKAKIDQEVNIIPVCYAVTYIFGTLGTVILLGNFGPALLGGKEKVKRQTAELEKELNMTEGSADPSKVKALRAVAYRAYIVSDSFFSEPRSVSETEVRFHNKGLAIFIDRIRHKGQISLPHYDDMISTGDEVVLCGPRESVVAAGEYIGKETANGDLLDYPLDRVGIVVAKKEFIGKPLHELRRSKRLEGVVIRDSMRDGEVLEIKSDTVFQHGDRLTILGQSQRLKNAARHIGYIDRPSSQNDIMFIMLAIFIGGLFGAMSFWIGSIPVSFGTSGGALVAGLLFGWLRSRRPTYGNIAPGALDLMNKLGLNVFIAVVGIEAAPSFMAGLKSVGPMLLVIGALCTLIPLFVGLFLGHKVFKFNPAITLGCCCGTRTCTAALGAVQSAIGSSLPAIGYTVTYAVSNLLLVLWGVVTVILV